MSTQTCPGRSRFLALLDGSLTPEESESIAVHVEYCPACARTIAELGNDTLAEALRAGGAATDTASDIRVKAIIDRHQSQIPVDVTGAILNLAGNVAGEGDDPSDILGPPQAADEIGRLGGYRILRTLGQGGMGLVFEAEDIKLERRVALKVMKREIAKKPGNRERFLREARTAAKVESDHICPIYQVGEENGVPFIAMPFLKGEPLDARLRRNSPLPLEEAVRIGREIAEGLAAAHDAGLVHRDIKPGNVWLEQLRSADFGLRAGNEGTSFRNSQSEFRIRILDFGLARLANPDREVGGGQLTQSGTIMGTPAYMAPEQARAKLVDHRADLFSLGVLLYEMTTGHRPFSGSDTMSILSSLALDTPTAPHELNPQVPAPLSALIQQLLAKEPEKRIQSAGEVVKSLTALIPQCCPTNPGTSFPAIANPWKDIDITEPAARPRNVTNIGARNVSEDKAGPSLTPRAQKKRLPVSSLIALGLAVIAAIAFGAYQLIFKTKDGTLVVNVDKDADVRFKNGELRIHDADGKLKYTLKPSEKNKKLPPGKYLVEVLGADGLKLETPEFTITKNGKASVRVMVDAGMVSRAPMGSAPGDPDRRAAEWVLAIGGSVMVDLNGKESQVRNRSELPNGVWILYRVDFKPSSVSDANLQNLAGLGGLKLIGLYGTGVTDAGMKELAKHKSLQVINLGSTAISDDGLKILNELPSLNQLDLDGTRVTDRGMKHLSQCQRLKALSLGGTKITDAGVKSLTGLSGMLHLNLGGTRISDAALNDLAVFRGLLTLNLDATEVTSAALTQVANLTTLQNLYVRKTKVTATGLQGLAAALPQCKIAWDGGVIEPKSPSEAARPMIAALLKSGAEVRVNQGQKAIETIDQWTAQDRLRSIHFSATPERKPLADPAVLAALQTLPAAVWDSTGYETVMLYGPVTEEQLKALVDSPGVRPIGSIHIHDSPLKDSALVHLARLPNLTRVILSANPGITDDGLKHLAAIPKFSHLVLRYNAGLTVAVLGKLRARALISLELNQLSGVDDMSIMQLAGMPSLEQLHIEGGKLTADGVKKLAAAMPVCKIQSDHGTFGPVPLTAEQRKALEWVLSIGGSVRITQNGQTAQAFSGQLPEGPCIVRDVSLQGNKAIDDKAIVNLKNLPPMWGLLDLGYTLMTDAGLATLKTYPLAATVRHLSLPMGITEVGMAHLKSFPQLTGVYSVSGTDAAIKHIKALPNLEVLWITERVTDAGLADLAELRFEDLSLAFNQRVTDAGCKHLARMTTLRKLSFQGTGVADAGLLQLKALTNLESLKMLDTQLTDAGMETVAGFKKLTYLDVRGTKVAKAGVEKLSAAMPQCKIEWDGGVIEPKPQAADPDRRAAEWVLSVGGKVRIQENGKEGNPKAVGELPRGPFELRIIDLAQNEKVSDSGLANLKDCKNLTHLFVHGSQVSDAGLVYLKECKNLTLVTLKKTKVTAVGIAELNKSLPNCKIESDHGTFGPASDPDRSAAEWALAIGGRVKVNNLDHDITAVSELPMGSFQLTALNLDGNKQVNDAGLTNVRDCKNLTHVNLNATPVSDAGLANFKDCKNLTLLWLYATQVRDVGLAHLKDCKNLTSLNLDSTKVGDQGLANFKNCNNLTNLNLAGTQVSDAGLAHFKDCKNLTHVWLHGTKVSDAGLAHLKDCKNLTDLRLTGTDVGDAGLKELVDKTKLSYLEVKKTKVTAAGVKKLAAARPNCKIESDHGTFEPKAP